MIYRIHKGKHRAWPPRLGLWYNKYAIRRRVRFDFDCRYKIESDDQYDINKLFGIGYFPNHHKESARFGWRFDYDENKFIISAYCYINGERVMKDICACVANKDYDMVIEVMPYHYEFYVRQSENNLKVGGHMQYRTHKKEFSYPLGLYFGGNQTAPHEMTIKMKRI